MGVERSRPENWDRVLTPFVAFDRGIAVLDAAVVHGDLFDGHVCFVESSATILISRDLEEHAYLSREQSVYTAT